MTRLGLCRGDPRVKDLLPTSLQGNDPTGLGLVTWLWQHWCHVPHVVTLEGASGYCARVERGISLPPGETGLQTGEFSPVHFLIHSFIHISTDTWMPPATGYKPPLLCLSLTLSLGGPECPSDTAQD
jgi:hypothetical protein